MKKFSGIILVLILIVSGSLFAQSSRSINFDGITYQVVTRPLDFITAFQNQNPAAILYRINDYLQIGQQIMGEAERLGLDVTQVYDPTTLVRADTMQLIPRVEVIRLIMPEATIIGPGSVNPVTSTSPIKQSSCLFTV